MSAEPPTLPSMHPASVVYNRSTASPAARAAATPEPGGPAAGSDALTRTSIVVTLAFVGLAALDTLHPARWVTGSWWLVLLVVWLTSWPGRPLTTAKPPRADIGTVLSLLTVGVFGWLFVRTSTAVLDVASYFDPIDLEGKLSALKYVLQDLVAGVLPAALFGPPLQRTFGRESTSVACIVGTPWFILTCGDTAFDLSRWSDRPLSNALWLFEATIVPLLLMEACALLERWHPYATRIATGGTRFTRRAYALFDRWPRRLSSSAAQPILLLTLCGFGLRFYVDDLPSLGPAASSAVLAVTPLCVLLLTFATVHELRRRRREHSRSSLWTRLRSGATTVVVTLILAPLWLWVLLVDAPLAEHYAKDTIAGLSGPSWTIEANPDRQTLSLSGEFQFGVAAAFTVALEEHPDTRRVELSGPGGLESEGLAIAGAIELRGLDTHVGSECASACTLAFVAGQRRTTAEDGLLGFHSVSSPIHLLADGNNQKYEQYFAGRGVDADFIRRATSTPPDDMWYPTNDVLLAAGVLTAID